MNKTIKKLSYIVKTLKCCSFTVFLNIFRLPSRELHLPAADGSLIEREAPPSHIVNGRLTYWGPQMPASAIAGLKGVGAHGFLVALPSLWTIVMYNMDNKGKTMIHLDFVCSIFLPFVKKVNIIRRLLEYNLLVSLVYFAFWCYR